MMRQPLRTTVLAMVSIALPLGMYARAADATLPVPATSVADSVTSSFEVNGIRVVHRRVTSNNVVAANLYLLGGTRQLTPATAGIEVVLLDASDRGTRRYTRTALRAKMARLGSAIVVQPAADWTLFGMRSTATAFDSTWSIFADRVMRPRLDSSEVALVRDQFAAGVAQRRDSPEALLYSLADSVAFSGHPYALHSVGDERSIAAITPRSLRAYHAQQMVTSRMLLVVVGNVERAHVERLVRTTIGSMPRGTYAWTFPAPIPSGASDVTVVHRMLPTNYVLGYYAGPLASSPDYQPLRVAAAVLSGRLFAEIRSRRNLTYAVNAPFVDRAASAGGLYVTTVAPDTTLALMRAEIARLQRDRIDPVALERLVQQFITEYFLDNETNAAQADFLARAHVYRGDYRAAERFVDELRDVTPADVQRVARRYMKGVRFAYVGDSTRLSRERIRSF